MVFGYYTHIVCYQEAEILVNAVRINTLSKLSSGDQQQFEAIISDIFVGILHDAGSDSEGLGGAIRQVMTEKPFLLEPNEGQMAKIIQFSEQLDQRAGKIMKLSSFGRNKQITFKAHNYYCFCLVFPLPVPVGCIIFGAPGSGKTTIWKVLEASLLRLGKPVMVIVMNPKAMSRSELLGSLDCDTREWKDGVLTHAVRQAIKEPPDVSVWIVCDGDVDPEWIENLNSVLDDNRLLTLASGERLTLGENINLVFETHNLVFASPATISRMGMIYLNENDIDASWIVSRWLGSLPVEINAQLKGWVCKHFHRALSDVGEGIVRTNLLGKINSALSHLLNCADEIQFLQGLVNGLGGNMAPADRSAFARNVMQWGGQPSPDYAHYSGIADKDHVSITMAVGDIILIKSVQQALSTIQPYIYDPFLLVGPHGCGKDTIIRHFFSLQQGSQVTTIFCNELTKPADIISRIKESCSLFSSNIGQTYRPRRGKLILYLKDIDAVAPDKYHCCMLHSFLFHLITYNGFHESLQFYFVEKIYVVASMTGERHQLDIRLASLFKICAVGFPSQKEMVTWCSTMMSKNDRFPHILDSQSIVNIAAAVVDIFVSVKSMVSTYERIHYKYTFSLRTLKNFMTNLGCYHMDGGCFSDCFKFEARRQFSDMLVGDELRDKIDSLIESAMKKNEVLSFQKEQLGYFSTLQSGSISNNERPFQFLSEEKFRSVVEQGISLYQREERELNLFLVPEILHHLARIEHGLKSLSGHLLLVGRSGVGRKTLTKLLCFMLQFRYSSPPVSVRYCASHFRGFLKKMTILAGIDGDHVCLLVEEHHLNEPEIFVLINQILSGDTSCLFTKVELDQLLAPLKDVIVGEGLAESPHDMFVSRVAKNLRVCLSIDETSDTIIKCSHHPSVFKHCKVLWLGSWSVKTMNQICTTNVSVREMITADEGGNDRTIAMQAMGPLASVTEAIVNIHINAKPTAAPLDFISLLNVWENIYNQKRKALLEEYHKFSKGIQKLSETREAVDKLRDDAKKRHAQMERAQCEADEAMTEITNELTKAHMKRKETEDLKLVLAQQTDVMTKRKADIEKELDEIQPILEEAKDGEMSSLHLFLCF